jgi:hypothetical protein
MSFTDQKPRVVTEKDLSTRWGGGKPGKKFRCFLCGKKFEIGDIWRWVYANHSNIGFGNFFVCADCDGPDVLERWEKNCAILKTRYWWIL